MWQSRLETYSQCRKAKNSFSLHKWNQSTMQWDITEISRKFMVRHVKFIILSCGNYGILLPRFCRKNSVGITFWWRTNRIVKKRLISWKKFAWHWNLCGSHIFGKNLVKVTVDKLLKIWFDEIFKNFYVKSI